LSTSTDCRAAWIAASRPPYDAANVTDWRGKDMLDGFLALYIFMLAAFTGYEIIARVPVILHTPLMSGSNFIHGIVLVGAMIALGHARTPFEMAIGFIGVLLGAGNAAGGYVVTERMLEMFKSSKPGQDRGETK
jgi:NAD(P) transhydrogenase subunit alpha